MPQQCYIWYLKKLQRCHFYLLRENIYSSFVYRSEYFASKTVLTVAIYGKWGCKCVRNLLSTFFFFLSSAVWLFEAHISVTCSHDEQSLVNICSPPLFNFKWAMVPRAADEVMADVITSQGQRQKPQVCSSASWWIVVSRGCSGGGGGGGGGEGRQREVFYPDIFCGWG